MYRISRLAIQTAHQKPAADRWLTQQSKEAKTYIFRHNSTLQMNELAYTAKAFCWSTFK
jgi:hypothetical protein